MSLARKNSILSKTINADYSANGDTLFIPNSGIVNISGTLTATSGNFTTVVVNGTSVSDFNSSVSGLLPTIANSGDNRILTSTGSTVGIVAESNLTFDGSLLNVVGSGSFSSNLNLSSQTVNTIASFDGSKNIVSLPTSTYPSFTELSYVKGVTSSIQTQLNGKAPTASPAFTGAATFANTGNVVPLTVTNTGTANSFVVNDASGDTTPFVITNSGMVGIRNATPSVELDVFGIIRGITGAEFGGWAITAGNTSTAAGTGKSVAYNFQGTDTVGSVKDVARIFSYPADNNWVGSQLAFWTRSGDSLSQRLTISSGGVVNIDGGGSQGEPILTSTVGGSDTGLWFPAADVIAFSTGGSERVRVDATGRTGIGTSTPSRKLHVLDTDFWSARFETSNAVAATIELKNTTTRTWEVGVSGSTSFGTAPAGAWYVYDATANAARMLVNTSGHVGIGASSPSCRLHVAGGGDPLVLLDTTTSETCAMHMQRGGVTKWYQYVLSTDDSLRFGTPSRNPILLLNTAGNVLVGTTNADPIGGNVEGVVVGPSFVQMSRSGALPLLLNRKTNDGDLVGFWQDGTFEGSISVAGNTVSYNAFCGSHWAQLIDGSRPAILRGTVLETIDEMCEWPDGKSDRLPRVKVSDTPRSRRVYGVFMGWDEDYASTGDMYATALGAYMVRVSGVVQSGDLLESAGDGTARTQSDDIVRSSTIGKVSSTHRVAEYDDGSYLVPCVLMCG